MAIYGKKQIVEGWQHDAHGWWWQNEDGSWVANDWRLINTTITSSGRTGTSGPAGTGGILIQSRWIRLTARETGTIFRKMEIFRGRAGTADQVERWKCGNVEK
mgnify:CR=1 FL=1